ncbi:hypothetical protein EVB99_040 [Rhizobium phage RHph_N3_19]|nr:hypothetical protein EVB99_040 [Rhizobium phage RHph_N3_19]
MYEDRKFQDGERVIFNSSGSKNPKYDKPGIVQSVHTYVGKSRGDYAYNIKFDHNGGVTPIWGADLTHGMFKYDPSQAGDTEEDI